MSKLKAYLVAYDLNGRPLTEKGQEELEKDQDWTVEHLFNGIWVLRTYLETEFVADKVSRLLQPIGSSLIVVPLSKKRLVHGRGIGPLRVALLRKYLADR